MAKKNNGTLRKSLNVSLQSKKYAEPINKLLDIWKDEGLNASTEVCENILLCDKIKKSFTLVNVLNAYNTAEQMVKLCNHNLSNEELNKIIDSVITSAIVIDNNKLIDNIKNLNNKLLTQTPAEEPNIDNSISNNTDMLNTINEQKSVEVAYEMQKDEVDDTMEYNIQPKHQKQEVESKAKRKRVEKEVEQPAKTTEIDEDYESFDSDYGITDDELQNLMNM